MIAVVFWERLEALLETHLKRMPLLPIVAVVLSALSFVCQRNAVMPWMMCLWQILSQVVFLYSLRCLAVDACKRLLSSAKYLSIFLWVSVIAVVVSVVITVLQVCGIFCLQSPVWLVSALAIVLVAPFLMLTLLAFVVSMLKVDGYTDLGKLFSGMVIAIFLTGAAVFFGYVFVSLFNGNVPFLKIANAASSLFWAYYAYRFFIRRNELHE